MGVGQGAPQFKRFGQFAEADVYRSHAAEAESFFGVRLDADAQGLLFQVDFTGGNQDGLLGVQQQGNIGQAVGDFGAGHRAVAHGVVFFILKGVKKPTNRTAQTYADQVHVAFGDLALALYERKMAVKSRHHCSHGTSAAGQVELGVQFSR